MLPNPLAHASTILRKQQLRAALVALTGWLGKCRLACDGRAVQRRDRLFQILCLDSDKSIALANTDIVGLLGEQAALLQDGLDVAWACAVAATDADVDFGNAVAGDGK